MLKLSESFFYEAGRIFDSPVRIITEQYLTVIQTVLTPEVISMFN